MPKRDEQRRTYLEMGPIQALSGVGTIDPTASKCRLTSTGAGQALSLADGTYEGQEVFIEMVVDGGSSVLTAGAALHLQNGIASITLVNAKDWIRLKWTKSAASPPVYGWELWGYGGGVTFT
jgi:hypothetical protein